MRNVTAKGAFQSCRRGCLKMRRRRFVGSRDGSSLDSYSKDSYSNHFLADSTDTRVWGINFESNEMSHILEIMKIYLVNVDSKLLF